jgi:O-antigen/teichoic acid export membrane protein
MIKENIIANIAGRIWGYISVFLFIPLYIKFLGMEAYGLVGFYSTLTGLLTFADLGFTATLNREMARLSAKSDSSSEMKDLLRTYEMGYLFISLVLSLSIWLLAPIISQHWLKSTTIPPSEIAVAIRLMGIAIALQLPAGLFFGGLMGLQRQVMANSIQILWSFVRGIGTILVLWLVSPTILSFAVWQILSNGLYCFLIRHNLWKVVSSGTVQPRFKWDAFRATWHYAIGMTSLSVIATILTQMDKLAVSKMLPLEMLGYYSLAGTLSVIPITMANPIALAVFPRLTGLVAVEDFDRLKKMYHRTSEIIAIVVIPAGLILAFFAADFIYAWTGSMVSAQRSGLAASYLIGGQLFQAITIVPFYLALSYGNVKLNFKVGISSIILITPILIYLINNFGIEGAGCSWLIMNILTFHPYMYYLHRQFLPGELKRWYWRSVFLPLLLTLPCIVIGRWIVPQVSSRILTLGLIASVWVVSMGAAGLISKQFRSNSINAVKLLFGKSYESKSTLESVA